MLIYLVKIFFVIKTFILFCVDLIIIQLVIRVSRYIRHDILTDLKKNTEIVLLVYDSYALHFNSSTTNFLVDAPCSFRV